jgi:hypothetical protein
MNLDRQQMLLVLAAVISISIILVSGLLLRGAWGVATTLMGVLIGGAGVMLYDWQARQAKK